MYLFYLGRLIRVISQTIVEYQLKEEETDRELKKIEAEKVKLLATVRAETRDLQNEKEKLQVTFAELQTRVEETKSSVSTIVNDISPLFLNSICS